MRPLLPRPRGGARASPPRSRALALVLCASLALGAALALYGAGAGAGAWVARSGKNDGMTLPNLPVVLLQAEAGTHRPPRAPAGALSAYAQAGPKYVVLVGSYAGTVGFGDGLYIGEGTDYKSSNTDHANAKLLQQLLGEPARSCLGAEKEAGRAGAACSEHSLSDAFALFEPSDKSKVLPVLLTSADGHLLAKLTEALKDLYWKLESRSALFGFVVTCAQADAASCSCTIPCCVHA